MNNDKTAADSEPTLRAVLAELVALKDFKALIKKLRAGDFSIAAEYQAQYDRRKPLAWEAARAALASVPAPDSAPKPSEPTSADLWHNAMADLADEFQSRFEDSSSRGYKIWDAARLLVEAKITETEQAISEASYEPDERAEGTDEMAAGNRWPTAENAAPDDAASLTEPAEKWPPSILEALKFYADGGHFVIHDNMPWDTVSGEPANFYEHDDNSATVEDGSIARAALAAKPEPVSAPTPKATATICLYRDPQSGELLGETPEERKKRIGAEPVSARPASEPTEREQAAAWQKKWAQCWHCFGHGMDEEGSRCHECEGTGVVLSSSLQSPPSEVTGLQALPSEPGEQT